MHKRESEEKKITRRFGMSLGELDARDSFQSLTCTHDFLPTKRRGCVFVRKRKSELASFLTVRSKEPFGP